MAQSAPVTNVDPYDHTLTLFDSVEAYNSAKPRHALPDLADSALWEHSYADSELPAQLPTALRESHAKAFILGLASFADTIKHTEYDPVSPYHRISSGLSNKEIVTDEAVRAKVSDIFMHKTVGHLSVPKSTLCHYIAKMLLANGCSKDALKGKLAGLGVDMLRAVHADQQVHNVYYKPAKDVSFTQLVQAIETIPGASFRGFLMAWLDKSKPHYSQPLLLFIGDAIARSEQLVPQLKNEFEEVKSAYRASGLEAAVDSIRTLVTQEQAKDKAR